jgi:hypothetical protein
MKKAKFKPSFARKRTAEILGRARLRRVAGAGLEPAT